MVLSSEASPPSRKIINKRIAKKIKEFELASTNANDKGKMVSLVGEMDVTAFLKDVRCPMLVMHSHDGKLVPFKYGRSLHEGIRGSKLVEPSDAGHTFFMSEDPRIAKAIISFH